MNSNTLQLKAPKQNDVKTLLGYVITANWTFEKWKEMHKAWESYPSSPSKQRFAAAYGLMIKIRAGYFNLQATDATNVIHSLRRQGWDDSRLRESLRSIGYSNAQHIQLPR